VTIKQVLAARDDAMPGDAGLSAVGIKLSVVPFNRTALPPESGPLVADGGFVRTPNIATRSGFSIKGQGEGRVMISGEEAVVLDGMYRFDSAPPNTATLDITPLEITLIGADGKEIMSRNLTVNSPSTMIMGTRNVLKAPITVKLRSGTVREVVVPFEFKDLPVRQP
jgi:hypothetical protein